MSDDASNEPSTTAALIEQMAKMMTQMAALQAAAISNPQLATQIIPQPVAMTEGILHSSSIDVKFDSTNYSFWSQAVTMYISGKERMKHLTGEPAPPSITEPSYQKWITDDAVVKGWLINSLEPRLKGSYIRYPTSRDIWKAIAMTYHDGDDEVQVYALNRQVMRVKQDGRAIEEYFDELQRLWLEIDFRYPNPMKHAEDINKFNTFIQKTRVYTFLDGLDDVLDGVRAQVVMLRPFPSIEQAYGSVRREATRQGIMIKGVDPNSVAMVSRGYKSCKSFDSQNKNYSQVSRDDKAKMKCTNCGKSRHTKEQCFEVVGYPDWWKGDKKKKHEEKSKGVAATAVAVSQQPTTQNHQSAAGTMVATGPEPVTKEEIRSCEGKNDKCKTNMGKCNISDLSKHRKDEGWVIDSGATDHMTHETAALQTMCTPRKTKIINANGEVFPVTGAGEIVLSNQIKLKNTLVVPSLATKLISISQLTKDQKCIVIMFPDHCIFQDILTKRIIGHGTRRDGLYYLDESEISNNYTVRGGHVTANNKIWTWHKRLGHPSFGYMKRVLPDLFVHVDPNNFSCETCIKFKSHRTTYYSSLNKCENLFELIHTDVWGPSPLISKSGCR